VCALSDEDYKQMVRTPIMATILLATSIRPRRVYKTISVFCTNQLHAMPSFTMYPFTASRYAGRAMRQVERSNQLWNEKSSDAGSGRYAHAVVPDNEKTLLSSWAARRSERCLSLAPSASSSALRERQRVSWERRPVDGGDGGCGHGED
jgi:hypothetical protein